VWDLQRNPRDCEQRKSSELSPSLGREMNGGGDLAYNGSMNGYCPDASHHPPDTVYSAVFSFLINFQL
jgi:hypothetical protein